MPGREQDEDMDVHCVSYSEIVEFISQKNVIGVVFFYASKYERLKGGDESRSLHGVCICDKKDYRTYSR